MNGLFESHLINRQGHHIASGIATCTSTGDLVQRFKDGAAMNVARKKGSIWCHEHAHGELVRIQTHASHAGGNALGEPSSLKNRVAMIWQRLMNRCS